MDVNKIGRFIAELRKEKKITQKELAEQLHITDKAVSKWERGLSCPDISLLTSIADILGVTAGELLNGQKSESTDSQEIKKTIDRALIYAEKAANIKITSFQRVLTISFSALMSIGIIVCSICDMAISGTFTWSLYPISSIAFAWLVFLPLLKHGAKGVLGSLIVVSILIIPFIYAISKITGKSSIMTIGFIMSILSVVYLWCVYFFFRKLKERKIVALALSLLLAIPLCAAINVSLAKTLSIPFFDIWDIFSLSAIALIVIALSVIDNLKKRKNMERHNV